MIIAISSDENDLNQTVSGSFGRCRYFCLYNTETLEAIFVENSATSSQKNAGAKAAYFLLEQNAGIVVACRFGTIAIVYLRENDIQIVIPQSPKTINEIINQLKKQII
ncbi:dinitrogenase iron-molybdenum cofactor biosynthesis protein [Dysgonomonas sp. HDW5A]|uniref:NifB/NifX family molybdenum-iron cluster-binding protein n=1 Tax=Dysgonomonas sp. HDW5A TaxID=2714926 RepID=UPI00140A557B|nr:NifB/NifX family molybdenum-iron cluster-binding protein [Dysgonomonas sp. HDW5A]QIK58554.1 dinitrogenase iron-molybdenum cofactor biosynthesis protein [Dysgonomonas sp. HDW5A]